MNPMPVYMMMMKQTEPITLDSSACIKMVNICDDKHSLSMNMMTNQMSIPMMTMKQVMMMPTMHSGNGGQAMQYAQQGMMPVAMTPAIVQPQPIAYAMQMPMQPVQMHLADSPSYSMQMPMMLDLGGMMSID